MGYVIKFSCLLSKIHFIISNGFHQSTNIFYLFISGYIWQISNLLKFKKEGENKIRFCYIFYTLVHTTENKTLIHIFQNKHLLLIHFYGFHLAVSSYFYVILYYQYITLLLDIYIYRGASLIPVKLSTRSEDHK